MTKKNKNTSWMLDLFCEKVVMLKELGYTEDEAKKVVKAAMNEAVEILIVPATS